MQQTATLLGVLYALVALRTGWRCARAGRTLFDSPFRAHDRRLLTALAFYWLVPLTVAGGLASSLGLFELWGAPPGAIHYGVYWARILPAADTALSPLHGAMLAATPGLFCCLVACLLIAWTFGQPIRAAHNFLRLEVARMLLGLTLLLQPTISMWLDEGSFYALVQAAEQWRPGAQYVLLLAHLAVMVGVILLWRSQAVRTRYLLLASPLFDEIAQARAELLDDADNADAQTDLAHSWLAAGDTEPALELLEQVLAQDPGEPRAAYLAGIAALKEGQPQRATAHLRAAGQRLEDDMQAADPALRLEVILALGAARLALGDSEGALLTMEEATRDAPREPRALFLHAEALVAAGRHQAARSRLERALSHAEGGLARAIRKRLRRFD